MKSNKSHSFSGRITRRIVLSMLLMMSLIAILIFLFARSGMTVLTSVHYQDILNNTNDKVEGMLNQVEVTAVNNLAEIQDHLGSPEEVFDALEKELRLNPHLIGYGVGFIPNYFPEQGHWFEPYVTKNNDGQIERLQIGSATHDYLNAKWFCETMEVGGSYWSDPYYDEAGAKAILCTYSAPVVDRDGRVAGVFGADFPLAWLYDQLILLDEQVNQEELYGKMREDEKIYSFILGRDGVYIAHPDKARSLTGNYFDYVGSEMSDVYRQIGEEMLEGKKSHKITYMDGVKSSVYYSPMSRAGWSMAIVVPTSALYRPGKTIATTILLLMGIGLLVTFLASFFLTRRTARPLRYLASSAEEIAQGNFNTPLPVIKNNDEVKLLRDSFENMQQSLSSYIDKLTAATTQQAMLEGELNIARKIQMEMLPKTFPPYPERKDIDIYGQVTPAKAVGGDMYDFFLQGNRLFFCIGDVSGKGVPGALWMAMADAEFRILAAYENSPEKIVSFINASLAARNESMMFATFFLGVLDLTTGMLTYCNAGHNAPMLLENGKQRFLNVASNVPLGVTPQWDFKVQQETIASGTTIFLYTDGLTEAEDHDHAQFGWDNMKATLRAPAKDAQALIENMRDAVQSFVGDAEQSDDLTLLAVRFLR
ncbi:MAG: SpoIIE family protein phosphatase [Bacteroidales bacterium]|nr:SpoIIE family protein phosphatase [Bacteroidales bacterium]